MFSAASGAQAGDGRWLGLSSSDRAIIDRMASDLYAAEGVNDPYQASRDYARAAPVDQARFRQERRNTWRSHGANQQFYQAPARTPYARLSPAQKAAYRRRAMDILGAQHRAYRAPGYGQDI